MRGGWAGDRQTEAAFGGRAAWEVRAGRWSTAPKPGMRLRLRLKERTVAWTGTPLATDRIFLFLPLVTRDNADFYEVIF